MEGSLSVYRTIIPLSYSPICLLRQIAQQFTSANTGIFGIPNLCVQNIPEKVVPKFWILYNLQIIFS